MTELTNTTIEVDKNMSAEINELATALSKAQSELESVGKGETGYGYNYASLPATIQLVKPVLAKNSLAITQLVGNNSNGQPSVTTILMHSSGQFIKSVASMELVEMKSCNVAQRAGAVYSYIRRYALQGILNISSEDNDASSNGLSKPTKTTTTAKKTTTTKKGGDFRKKPTTTTETGASHDI
jgi:hypothetical protein